MTEYTHREIARKITDTNQPSDVLAEQMRAVVEARNYTAMNTAMKKMLFLLEMASENETVALIEGTENEKAPLEYIKGAIKQKYPDLVDGTYWVNRAKTQNQAEKIVRPSSTPLPFRVKSKFQDFKFGSGNNPLAQLNKASSEEMLRKAAEREELLKEQAREDREAQAKLLKAKKTSTDSTSVPVSPLNINLQPVMAEIERLKQQVQAQAHVIGEQKKQLEKLQTQADKHSTSLKQHDKFKEQLAFAVIDEFQAHLEIMIKLNHSESMEDTKAFRTFVDDYATYCDHIKTGEFSLADFKKQTLKSLETCEKAVNRPTTPVETKTLMQKLSQALHAMLDMLSNMFKSSKKSTDHATASNTQGTLHHKNTVSMKMAAFKEALEKLDEAALEQTAKQRTQLQ